MLRLHTPTAPPPEEQTKQTDVEARGWNYPQQLLYSMTTLTVYCTLLYHIVDYSEGTGGYTDKISFLEI